MQGAWGFPPTCPHQKQRKLKGNILHKWIKCSVILFGATPKHEKLWKVSLKTGSISFKEEHGFNDGSDRQVRTLWYRRKAYALYFQVKHCQCQNCVDCFCVSSRQRPEKKDQKNILDNSHTQSTRTLAPVTATLLALPTFPTFPCAACTLSLRAASCLFCSSGCNLLYLFPLYSRNAITTVMKSFRLSIYL